MRVAAEKGTLLRQPGRSPAPVGMGEVCGGEGGERAESDDDERVGVCGGGVPARAYDGSG